MQDLLGELIPKGERCGSKQGMFPTKGEKYSQEGKIYSKGEEMSSELSHEGEVARKGKEQKGESWF